MQLHAYRFSTNMQPQTLKPGVDLGLMTQTGSVPFLTALADSGLLVTMALLLAICVLHMPVFRPDNAHAACQIGIHCHTYLVLLACRRLGIANLRYDSVSGVHPNGKTPIVVTYNSGHAYPRYLVTYKA